ncbi:HeH/LEM domain-containing protein [Pseudomonas corrugata]|uniref:HeH/LEM domain-containing protein n=1 Tax=Pseudomonas corrugata TaxID=47879 RepID=UPI00083D5605|nr:HeH/LEM domain-containing protein [Pseudomonas corrugata]AOE63785.1 hypothetical protein AXG94_19150 [Pseudomonas corrugata]
MPVILVTKAFPFAVDGNDVVQVEVGEQEVTDRCALVAVEHLGVATLVGGAVEPDPLKMKIEDLRVWLTGKGIEFDQNAKKPELQALVPKND